jgi:ribosomal protein S18 acetylase RimI-like enzyme
MAAVADTATLEWMEMTDVTTDLRAIVHASLLTPSPLQRYRPGQERRATHGNIGLFTAGEPGPDLNYVMVLGPASPTHVFALADAFFDTGEFRYSVVVEVETARPVEEEVRARGWRLVEEEPALVLPHLPTLLPSPPSNLDIRQVTDEDGLTNFRAVSRTGQHIVPSLAAALDPGVALFVGYTDGRPVATSRLVCLGTVAEITGVRVMPEHRRRGYGTALTWAAVREGAARGCATTILTATAMGYPLYVRMGFLPVCTYRTYLPPEESGT